MGTRRDGRGGGSLPDEKALVKAHQAGDGRAFQSIVRLHYPHLLAYAVRRLRERPAAEDAVQDTFLRAYRALPGFNGEYNVGGWLHRILANVCTDELARRTAAGQATTRLMEMAPPSAEQPESFVIDEEARRRVVEALAHLPASHRHALVLREVYGMAYRQVASVAGVSEENARARVQRARRALHGMLSGLSAAFVARVYWFRHRRPGGAQAVGRRAESLASVEGSAAAQGPSFTTQLIAPVASNPLVVQVATAAAPAKASVAAGLVMTIAAATVLPATLGSGGSSPPSVVSEQAGPSGGQTSNQKPGGRPSPVLAPPNSLPLGDSAVGVPPSQTVGGPSPTTTSASAGDQTTGATTAAKSDSNQAAPPTTTTTTSVPPKTTTSVGAHSVGPLAIPGPAVPAPATIPAPAVIPTTSPPVVLPPPLPPPCLNMSSAPPAGVGGVASGGTSLVATQLPLSVSDQVALGSGPATLTTSSTPVTGTAQLQGCLATPLPGGRQSPFIFTFASTFGRANQERVSLQGHGGLSESFAGGAHHTYVYRGSWVANGSAGQVGSLLASQGVFLAELIAPDDGGPASVSITLQ